MTREAIIAFFTAIPTLETDRLILRRLTPADAADMYEYSKESSVVEHLLWDAHPSRDYTERYLCYLEGEYALGNFYDWAIVHRADGKMIGTCGFTSIDPVNNCAEIGYVIHPAYRGQGIAAEATRTLLSLGFETFGLMRISGICMVENLPSLRVMQKCGMEREGVLHAAVYAKGRYRDVVVAAITAETYFRR